MERATILDHVRMVFAEHLSIVNVGEDSHLFRDLRLDSIQQLTLVVELENRFQICFDDADEVGIETVRDIVELVARRIAIP